MMNFIYILIFTVISVLGVVTCFFDGSGRTMTKSLINGGRNINDTSTKNTDRKIGKVKGHFCANLLCICTEWEASCVGHEYRLQYIPELPENITSLVFKGNQLPFLNVTSLRNASNLQLENLEFHDNNIIHVTNDAFKNFKYLKYLDLSKNKGILPDDVMRGLYGLKNSPIDSVYFYEMDWSDLPNDMFKSIFGSKLASINLSLNKLEIVQGSLFSGLKHLVFLNLASNKLRDMNMTGLSTVRFLTLSGNSFYRIPTFCESSGQSALPSLEDLDMDDNKIDFITEETFMCLDNLIKLTIRKNPILNIKNNFLQSLRSLKILYLSEIGLVFHEINIENYAFNSSSLERLYFEGNALSPGYYDPELLFANCHYLQYLILSYTKLPKDPHILRLLLSPLKNLNVLRMDSTGLDNIPVDLFSDMKSLVELSLNDNNIHSWDGTKLFKGLKITRLFLSKNQIAIINETSFPPTMMFWLDSLDIKENPFSCTCPNVPSIKWLRHHSDLLLGYPEGYKCGSPPALKDILIKDYNPSPESCREKDITLLVGLPVSLVSIFTFISIFSIYKFRWRLRYWLYMVKQRHKGYEQIPNSENCVYAGFVIYSDSDREWVHSKLLHRMEDVEGFKLCIRHRDFEVGKVHVDNIVENMVLSKKIIVVLSNNFAVDEWCHLQLLLAETKLLKENIDVLVLVMLEEINSDCLRASLFQLVANEKYTPWSVDETGNCLFWKKLISNIKAPTTIN